jgi:hypothetical protein
MDVLRTVMTAPHGARQIQYPPDRNRNRRVNHAIHMAAITQIRHRHSEGRAALGPCRREGQSRDYPPAPPHTLTINDHLAVAGLASPDS